jgi:hypothetical protein
MYQHRRPTGGFFCSFNLFCVERKEAFDTIQSIRELINEWREGHQRFLKILRRRSFFSIPSKPEGLGELEGSKPKARDFPAENYFQPGSLSYFYPFLSKWKI